VHRSPSVADNLRRFPPNRRDHGVARDEQPMRRTCEVPFDQHVRARFPRPNPGGGNLLPRVEIDRDAATVVRVARLDDDRQTDLVCRRPGIIGVANEPSLGGRQPELPENTFGEEFVTRDRLGEISGAAGDDSLNAALARTVSELHQTVAIDA